MLLQLSPTEIIFFSLVFAFIFATEVTLIVRRLILRWIHFWDWKKRDFSRYNRARPNVVRERKPWDCMKCMTGWFALLLSLLSGYNWESLLWWIVGLFAGAIFTNIKMRWL